MKKQNLIVYSGRGSSHSWTWLADMFEARGVHDVRFLGSEDFIKAVESEPTFVIISGGDGFAIADALSGLGFHNLRDYIQKGGTYIGICAGAYLPLPSSIPPFSEFNLSSTMVENIDCTLRPLDGIPPRIAVKYGHCAIVHPVRGEVELEHRHFRYVAPIYGGPVFREPVDDDVLMRYRAFSLNTEFQILKQVASGLVLDRPAAVRATFGTGTLLLFGPHLEHPHYGKSNRLFFEITGLHGHRWKLPPFKHKTTEPLAKALADLKVATLGLENRSFVVGKKIWDGGRYMDLLNAMEKRVCALDDAAQAEAASALLKVRDILVGTSVGAETDVDEATDLLVQTARACVDRYFLAMADGR
jgi:hypothetical protein